MFKHDESHDIQYELIYNYSFYMLTVQYSNRVHVMYNTNNKYHIYTKTGFIRACRIHGSWGFMGIYFHPGIYQWIHGDS